MPRGSAENWMPIKCQRVTKQEVGAKGPAPALADSSLGLEEPRGEVGISCILECWNVGGLLPVCALWFVVCGLWFVEEFQNSVQKLVCLGS